MIILNWKLQDKSRIYKGQIFQCIRLVHQSEYDRRLTFCLLQRQQCAELVQRNLCEMTTVPVNENPTSAGNEAYKGPDEV